MNNNNNLKTQSEIQKIESFNAISEVNIDAEEIHSESTKSQSKFIFSNLLKITKRRLPNALMGFSGVLLGAILYLIFAQKNYQATTSIILEARQESISELGKNLNNIVSNSNEYSPLANQAELIKSKPVLNNALEKFTQKTGDTLPKNISYKKIQKKLKVTIIPQTNILEISYVNTDPEFAALLLNEIINALIGRNTDIIRSEARSVRQFLEKEVNKQQTQLNQRETSENFYRQQNGIIALDNQTVNLVNRLNNLETQEQNLLTQIIEQETKVNNIKQIGKVNDAESAYIKGKIGQDSQLEKLRTQLTNVEAELSTARSTFTDNNPTVITLLEKRAEILDLYQKQVSNISSKGANISSSGVIKDGLSQEVFNQLIVNQTQLQANKDKLKAIQIEQNKLEKQIALLPAKVQSLTELVRQREQAHESLQFLQRQLEEAKIAEAQLVSNIQIVELASAPSSPSSPKVPLVLAIALMVGTILAFGIILLLEKIDRTLYDGAELEQQLNLPFLITLPHLPYSTSNISQMQLFLNNGDLYEHYRGLDEPDLFEPYRSLLKRLESRGQNKLKVIVVTSAIAEEGKSMVASHLGAVSAMLSRRTLIIDAHLRKPEQYRWFDVKLQPGLAETVTDGLSLDQAIQSTKIENLSILSSGISTSNSSMILESPSIKSILQEAAIKYDLVIVDTPPVSSSCDAYTLSEYSNGLLMVTRPCHTIKDTLEDSVVDLRRNNASIIGFVINNADKQKQQFNDELYNLISDAPRMLLDSSQTDKSSQDN